MSYKIKWLGNDLQFRHALVTEKRWFKPARYTEVELKPTPTQNPYLPEVWFHYKSTIPVFGRHVTRMGYSEVSGGDGLQRLLWDARMKEIGYLRKQSDDERDALRKSEEDAQWCQVERLPRACATFTNCRAEGDIIVTRCAAGCKGTCRHLVVTRES